MPEPLLRAQNLHKSYGRHKVLQGVSFDVRPGTLVGIVGENGAGKSTLLRILAGDLRPNSGKVIRSGAMGYCPQNVILNDALSVNQHLDYFRAAYNIGSLQRASELIEELGYPQYRRTQVANLSGGTKQKLNLTLALMHEPKLLLLDEPYQGFDWETYLRFWDIVSELRERGCAVLVISHLFFDQERFDDLYRLRDGKVWLQDAAQTSATQAASLTGKGGKEQ
ncbi:MAG TPA: ABC transporter ATP-binding protein [Ktedonobacteraceae bacterium]|nr:ABC transporter ATP-binding protein [Ktedonobacteraceae bacterium]